MSDVKLDEIVQDIKNKTKGLLFLSEAEFPVEVYCCDSEEPLSNNLLKLSGRSINETMEEVPLSFLFRNLNSLQGNENYEEDENAKKYQDLIKYLTETLINLKVYRV